MGNCLGSSAIIQNSTVPTSPGNSTRSAAAGGGSSSSHSESHGSALSGSADEVAEALVPEGRILEVPNLRVFTLAELRSATRNFRPDTVLGEGGFGRVYRGWVDEKTLNPSRSCVGMAVAVKKLNHESLQGLEQWKSEVNFLGRLSHPNLVKLLGFCYEDRELLLVYEYVTKGSLENHLFGKGATLEELSWCSRIKIAIGAARGLAFLHSSEEQIIYRDFKASNILIDSNYTAKLADFGLAKQGPVGGDTHVTTKVIGTFGYAAPEYIATGHLYVKSDVYGFGVVLLEILTGQRAIDLNRPRERHNLVDYAKPLLADRRKLAQLMDPRLRGQCSSRAALQAAQLTLQCLSGDHRRRPSMDEVLQALEQIEAIKKAGT